MKELFHPKGLYQRKYLLFKRDPTFIRERLCFILLRRFLNIVIFVAFISFGLARAYPGTIVITPMDTGNEFLVHVQSTVTGLTSLGVEPLEFRRGAGSLFVTLRSAIGYLVLVSLVGLLVNGLSKDNVEAIARDHAADIRAEIGQLQIADKDDVRTALEIVLMKIKTIDFSDMSEDTRVFDDYGFDSLDKVHFRFHIEDVFGIPESLDDEFEQLNTLRECIEYCQENGRAIAAEP
jgi:acyl carrier protein